MIIFNTDDCIKCEACEGICPSNAIKVQPNNIITVIPVAIPLNVLKYVSMMH